MGTNLQKVPKLYSVDSQEMESSIIDASAASRKRRRDEEEEEELEQVFFIIVSVATMFLGALTWYHDKYLVKEPAQNLELERHSFLNHLYKGTEIDCIEQLRVNKKAFFKLCRILQEKGQLVKTRNVPIAEAVAMFWHILAQHLKYRVVHFSYCRSMKTISRQFKNVLRAIMKVSKEYLKFHDYNLKSSVENKWRWFKNSIGGLDGIHIPVTVVVEDRPRYHNRKGKYFLVDAGYTNGPGFLAHYRGTRYHLNDARNIIERSFGLLKKRWGILRTLSFFYIKTQIRSINVCFILHNFIRDEQQSDPILEAQDLELLSIVHNELINQQMERVTNNIGDEVTTFQVTEEYTRFCDTLAMNIEMESTNVKNKSSGKRKMSSEDTRSYFAWNLEMERVLTNVLRDQRNLDNKGDGNWRAVTYSTAAQIFSKHFGVHLMGDNVKNHFKLWRTWYEIASDILIQIGFDWDSTKYMITVENEIAWNEYVKSHEEVKRFQFKVIPNWDDIVDLYSKDRATGLRAKNALDANDIMSKEINEEEAIHSVTNSLTKAKMLGIFKEKLVKAPKELNNPASLNSCTKPKPSHEILKDFMPCNSSNAFSMCFGNDALLAYSPSNKPSIHHRLFSGLDNIYCVFLGGLHSLSMVNKQYGLSKGTNKALFITEAYQTLRDRGPYPADQVLKELEGSLGFVIYDNKDGTIFVAFGSNGQIGLYWGVVAYSSIVIYENMELIKASCAKLFAPFPTGLIAQCIHY
ncbi:Stem-specific protein TSJT1 [Glycine soja]